MKTKSAVLKKKTIAKTKIKPTLEIEKYLLQLYITGNSPRSLKAIENIKRICENHLQGDYKLEVIDIYKKPEMASGEQIIAAPTLVKSLPHPKKKLIGDLSDEKQVLSGLDITFKSKGKKEKR